VPIRRWLRGAVALVQDRRGRALARPPTRGGPRRARMRASVAHVSRGGRCRGTAASPVPVRRRALPREPLRLARAQDVQRSLAAMTAARWIHRDRQHSRGCRPLPGRLRAPPSAPPAMLASGAAFPSGRQSSRRQAGGRSGGAARQRASRVRPGLRCSGPASHPSPGGRSMAVGSMAARKSSLTRRWHPPGGSAAVTPDRGSSRVARLRVGLPPRCPLRARRGGQRTGSARPTLTPVGRAPCGSRHPDRR